MTDADDMAPVLGPIGSLIEKAMGYAGLGFDLFPVNPRDKRPLVSQLSATTDLDSIEAWWNTWPDALIGHRLPAHQIILDIDPRHGGLDVWNALKAECPEIGPTRAHYSGRGDGGGHVWYLRPDDKVTITKLDAWARERGLGTPSGERWSCGIDILRHEHRYTILPPSLHPATGRPYTWGEGRGLAMAVQPMPQLLVDLIVRDEAPTPKAPSTGFVDPTSIADWYSSSQSWRTLLGRHEWVLVGGDGESDGSRWRHPTSDSAHSATIRHGCLFVYSPNTPFEVTTPDEPHGYTLYRALAVLEHHGDLKEAGRAARELKGDPIERPFVDEDGVPRRVIQVNSRPFADVVSDTVEGLVETNDPPSLFSRAGVLTRVRVDENGRPIVEPINAYQMRNRIASIGHTVRVNKDGGTSHVPPPLDVVNDILASPSWPFPPLEAVTELPTLRADGTIHDQPGYDPQTRLLYIPNGIEIPQVSSSPSRENIDDAAALLGELLADFPFDGDGDYVNALGLLLTPVVRSAISGQVPLALIDAPEPGTGKGLLANIAAVVATGRPAAARPLARADDEVRKMLTAVLIEGPALVVLDNVEDAIRSPSLAAVLTTDEWTDRLLGRSETITVPNRCTWVATGNNLGVAGDIGRRCYRIRLDAHQARPYTRSGFQHPDLIGWAQRNRGRLVAALLTIARAWWSAGQPKAKREPVIGGFTPWARTIAGILEHAQLGEFLSNLDELHATLDIESESWEAFLSALHETFTDRRVTAADVAREIDGEYSNIRYVVPAELVDSVGKPRLAKKLGEAFRRREGRRHGDSELVILEVGRARNKTKLWSIVPLGSSQLLESAGTAGTRGDRFIQREEKIGENDSK